MAEVLLAYGVQKVIYPKVSNRVKKAFQELNLEIVNGNFEKLSDVLNYVFP
jgi:predicted Fe-Mo cluster-binding NifX family protein